jgi:hypothetical protein
LLALNFPSVTSNYDLGPYKSKQTVWLPTGSNTEA